MQVDEAYRAEKLYYERQFSKSMRWLNRNGTEYLHVKKGQTEKSMGLARGYKFDVRIDRPNYRA
jgi:hypothetical protein